MKNTDLNTGKRALVMSLTDHSSDPRPRRITRFLLENQFSVDVVSYPFKAPYDASIRKQFSLKSPSFDLVSKIIRRLKSYTPALNLIMSARSREKIISSRFEIDHLQKQLENEAYDLIVVEDLYLIPLAFRVKKDAQIFFDGREFYPSQNEESFFFRLFEKPERNWLCKEYLHKIDVLVTTSYGFKDLYDQNFGTDFKLLRSVPSYFDRTPSEPEEGSFRMVHHGAANRNRQIEKMIEVTRRLDERFTLDLYLTGELKYIDELKAMTRNDTRVQILDPVNFEDIIPTINRYDIGFFYVEPTTQNLRYCLPNKLFEFIQGRLLVAIGPSPDMAEVVRKYECGVISDEFSVESMLNTLSSLTSDTIQKCKYKSHEAAKIFCFENEKKELNTLLKDVL